MQRRLRPGLGLLCVVQTHMGLACMGTSGLDILWLQADKRGISERLQSRLSLAQQQAVLTNHALLLLAAGQSDACAALLTALQARQAPCPCSACRCSRMDACLLCLQHTHRPLTRGADRPRPGA